jgi:hypothetical protein
MIHFIRAHRYLETSLADCLKQMMVLVGGPRREEGKEALPLGRVQRRGRRAAI